MSEVKRYWHMPGKGFAVLDPCYYCEDNGYVAFEDFDKQAQEIERLNALLSRDPNVIVTELRQTRLSIDTPNQYKQDLIDCIIGAMAFGFQNANPPPEGHWGKQFWDLGREEGRRQEELESELSQLKSRQSGVVLPERLDIPEYYEFESADTFAAAVGEAKKWNDCIDEVARLNSSTGSAGVAPPDERSAFEDAYRKAFEDSGFPNAPKLERVKQSYGERYADSIEQACWEGWQARAALSSPNPAEQLNKAQGDAVDVVAWLSETFANGRTCQRAGLSKTSLQGLCHGTEDKDSRIISDQPLMTVAQHERIVAALAAPPSIPKTSVVVERELPFVKKVIAKLKRFNECAEDPGADGVDIGRHWLDLLTQLGLLNRVQRNPALWEISQQGEDAILSSKGGDV